MIEKIFDMYPVVIHDVDNQNKNVVLLAIENRRFKPWRVTGAAMLMQWECNCSKESVRLEKVQFVKLVKNSMLPNFYEPIIMMGKQQSRSSLTHTKN
ncbi:ankyrin repeat-containing protein NPR4 [Trifolium repens]|nr:ankyrin repeat-containing protein NPR4 [Trifolium repens]